MSLVVFGSVNVDHVWRCSTLPRPGETASAVDYATLPGGKGANQACAAAKISLPSFQGGVTFVGAIGVNDDLSERAIRASGAVCALTRRSDADTGRACVLVDENGENSIAVYGGANALVDASSVPMDDARVLLLQCEIPLATDVAAARTMRERNPECLIFVNYAPATVVDLDLVALADVLIVNETELEAVGDAVDAGAVAEAFAERRTAYRQRAVVCTRGAKGAEIFTGDDVPSMLRSARHDASQDAGYYVHVGPTPVRPEEKIVDTVGAGDAFVGAFAAAVAAGLDVASCCQIASAAGLLACTQEGARPDAIASTLQRCEAPISIVARFASDATSDVHATKSLRELLKSPANGGV